MAANLGFCFLIGNDACLTLNVNHSAIDETNVEYLGTYEYIGIWTGIVGADGKEPKQSRVYEEIYKNQTGPRYYSSYIVKDEIKEDKKATRRIGWKGLVIYQK